MSKYFRFVFEKGGSHSCPSCGVQKKYSRYIDLETEELLPEKYGKCNRVENCGYHLNPYRDGYLREVDSSNGTPESHQPRISAKTSETFFIPNEVLESTLCCYDQNLFIDNLKHTVPHPFLPEDVDYVCRLYQIGTIHNGYMKGATTFPFIDEKARVRFIQVKLFDSLNHTIKTDSLSSMYERQYQSKAENMPSWPARSPAMPKWLQEYGMNDLKVSCLFGAHLLSLFPKNRIALVEAPKTAIYGSLYFGLPSGPEDLLWLAVYSRDTLTVAKCLALHGRKVYLFPDLSKDGSTYQKWQGQADEIQRVVPGLRIVVSDLLERIANRKSRTEGEDLADLLSHLDWRPFRRAQVPKESPCEITSTLIKVKSEESQTVRKDEGLKEPKYATDSNGDIEEGWDSSETFWFSHLGFVPGSWDADLADLEQFFSSMINSERLPAPPIQIGNYPPIHNIHGFIKMNLETAKGQSGNPTYKPYFERLLQLKDYLLLIDHTK